MVAIEHNKQFLHSCDWCIELGPEAGEEGGEVIGWGTSTIPIKINSSSQITILDME